jgi:hypothetical protein
MSQTPIDLSDGKAMVACVIGRGYKLPKDISGHPQVAVYNGLEKFDTGALPPLPPKDVLKAVVYTDGLALDRTQALQHEAKRRGILYVSRNTDGSLTDLLRNWIATSPRAGHLAGTNGHHVDEPEIDPSGPPPPHEPIELQHTKDRVNAPRGAIQELVKENHDPHAPVSAEARRLVDIAKRKGFPTTVASVEQAIRTYRRRHGIGGVPESLLPPEERDRLAALKTLDDAIAGLQLMRDWVERTEAENVQLKAKLAAIQGVFGSVK